MQASYTPQTVSPIELGLRPSSVAHPSVTFKAERNGIKVEVSIQGLSMPLGCEVWAGDLFRMNLGKEIATEVPPAPPAVEDTDAIAPPLVFYPPADEVDISAIEQVSTQEMFDRRWGIRQSRDVAVGDYVVTSNEGRARHTKRDDFPPRFRVGEVVRIETFTGQEVENNFSSPGPFIIHVKWGLTGDSVNGWLETPEDPPSLLSVAPRTLDVFADAVDPEFLAEFDESKHPINSFNQPSEFRETALDENKRLMGQYDVTPDGLEFYLPSGSNLSSQELLLNLAVYGLNVMAGRYEIPMTVLLHWETISRRYHRSGAL